MLRPLEGEPRAAVPSEASLLVLPQVAPRIRAQLRRGEWVLSAGPSVVWPPEASPLVGSLCQVLPRQVQLVSPPQAQTHPESPPPVQQPQGLLASPPQVGQQQAKHQAAGSSPQRS